MFLLLLLLYPVLPVDPETGAVVQRLLAQRELLIQPGLSYRTGSKNESFSRSSVSCTLVLENWTRWLLGSPVYYLQYGQFLASKFSSV